MVHVCGISLFTTKGFWFRNFSLFTNLYLIKFCTAVLTNSSIDAQNTSTPTRCGSGFIYIYRPPFVLRQHFCYLFCNLYLFSEFIDKTKKKRNCCGFLKIGCLWKDILVKKLIVIIQETLSNPELQWIEWRNLFAYDYLYDTASQNYKFHANIHT